MSATARTSHSASSALNRCIYQRHSCSRPRYLHYKYCAQHIVEDSQSPFTMCNYLSRTTGRKCPNPALRSKKNSMPGYCSEHLHDMIVKEKHQKQKRKLRRKRKNEKSTSQHRTPGTSKRQRLVERLYKYSQGTTKPQGEERHESSDSEVEEVHRPIKDDWPLENSSSFDTDADWDDFDSVNNEVYEPLRYADVLTPEEVVATAQSKLIRLQSLYIEQFKRLFHLLKERRRQYLEDRKKELKEEKATAGLGRYDVEYEENDEVYALATCGRRTGVEALLRKKYLQKRGQMEGKNIHGNISPKPTTLQRCTHTSNHARCQLLCLPYTKYCASHILEDPHQLLYRKCRTTDCPMPVRHLTARPYLIPTTNDAEADTQEVCYCAVHAPLPEMTYDFPDITEGNEKMEVCEETSEEKVIDCPEGSNTAHTGLHSSNSDSSNKPTANVDEACGSALNEASVRPNSEKRDNCEGVDAQNSIAVLPLSSSQNALVDGPQSNIEKTSAGKPVSHVIQSPSVSPSSEAPACGDKASIRVNMDDLDIKPSGAPESMTQEVCDPIESSEVGEKDVPDSTFVTNEKEATVEPVDSSETRASDIAVPDKEQLTSAAESTGDPDMTPSGRKENLGKEEHEPISGVPKLTKKDIPGSAFSPGEKEATAEPVVLPEMRPGDVFIADPNLPTSASENHILPLPKEAVQPSQISGRIIGETNQPTDVVDSPKPLGENANQLQESTAQPRYESSRLCEFTGELIPVTDDPETLPAVTVSDEKPSDGKSDMDEQDVDSSGREDSSQGVVTGTKPIPVPGYMSDRGERKPSSAEEEMAVVSLLQLCTGHASDDTASSSAEQE